MPAGAPVPVKLRFGDATRRLSLADLTVKKGLVDAARRLFGLPEAAALAVHDASAAAGDGAPLTCDEDLAAALARASGSALQIRLVVGGSSDDDGVGVNQEPADRGAVTMAKQPDGSWALSNGVCRVLWTPSARGFGAAYEARAAGTYWPEIPQGFGYQILFWRLMSPLKQPDAPQALRRVVSPIEAAVLPMTYGRSWARKSSRFSARCPSKMSWKTGYLALEVGSRELRRLGFPGR